MIYHCDKGEDIKNIEITAQGFLKVIGTVAHVGYLYYEEAGGGIRKEYVPIETLFSEEHIKSTETSVPTLNHPPAGIEVNPQFWAYSKGSIQKALKNEDKQSLMVEMIIGSQDAIDAIKSGITCLSMGYSCDVEQIGENEYIQKRRICNHIAIVEQGRAKGAKLHLDQIQDSLIDKNLKQFYQQIYPIKLKSITL